MMLEITALKNFPCRSAPAQMQCKTKSLLIAVETVDQQEINEHVTPVGGRGNKFLGVKSNLRTGIESPAIIFHLILAHYNIS